MMRIADQSSTSRIRFEKMSLPVMMCLPFGVGGRFRFGPVTRLRTCKHVDVSVASSMKEDVKGISEQLGQTD